MRSCVGKGVRTHVECLEEGQGNCACQFDRGAHWPQDDCRILKESRRKGQSMARFAILAVLLAVEAMMDGL